MIHTLAILLLFQLIGEGLAYALALPVPGPAIGMVLLLLLMGARRRPIDKLAVSGSQFLGQMSLFFVPAGVGILVHADRVAAEWMPIAIALVASTVVSIVVTAVVIRWLQR
jgi:holin-like protein